MHIPECMALFHSSVQKSSPQLFSPWPHHSASTTAHSRSSSVCCSGPVSDECSPNSSPFSLLSIPPRGKSGLRECALAGVPAQQLLSAPPPALAWDGLLQNAPHENPYHHVFHNAPENNWFCYSLSPLDCF